jgi:L-ribulose-5-phosphate 4-epimerase
LHKLKLAPFNWCGVSGIDRQKGLIVIKVNDLLCKEVTTSELLVVDMEGRVVEGKTKGSFNASTHLRMYEAFPQIGGIALFHSTWATVFAQAGLEIPAYGTMHAKYFKGAVPCTRSLTADEIKSDFDSGVGRAVAEAFHNTDALSLPGALVKNHAPVSWGESPFDAVQHAAILEKTAKLAYRTRVINALHGNEPITVSNAMLDYFNIRNEDTTELEEI